MKVILLQDVKSLGKKDQIVEVSDGYARNMLFPKKLALEASAKNINDLKLKKAHDEKVAKEQLADARAFAEELAKMEKICPHFHLSLQSGCDATLARMNRKYTTEEYENACSILRKNFTHPAITTDVIVGFPGETEEEFAQTKEYLKRIHFYEMHIFKYSRRQGTRAAVMEHQVPEEIKTKRSAQLLALAESMSREFRAYYVGKEEEVLFEEPMEVDGETWYTGYTKEYVKIAAKTAEPLDNVMKRGRVEAALTDEIYRMKL
jgi:threonylcarbamoyladenosine tRNA methylthiotransferase MtaB